MFFQPIKLVLSPNFEDVLEDIHLDLPGKQIKCMQHVLAVINDWLHHADKVVQAEV